MQAVKQQICQENPHLAFRNGFTGYKKFREDVVEVPFKCVAMQILSQFLPFIDITIFTLKHFYIDQWNYTYSNQLIIYTFVIVLLVFIEPNFGQSKELFQL